MEVTCFDIDQLKMLIYSVKTTSKKLQRSVTNLNYEIADIECCLAPREKVYKLCVEDFADWKKSVSELGLMKEKRNYILADIRMNGALIKLLKDDLDRRMNSAAEATQPTELLPVFEDEISEELF